jgi:hypothetical protein
MMRTIGNHREMAILRAVAGLAGLAEVSMAASGSTVSLENRQKPILVIEEIRSTDWASATFAGAIHEFELRIEGIAAHVAAALEALAGLPDLEIPMSGHFVAEIGMVPGAQFNISDNMVSQTLTVNALTIID